MSGVVDSDPVGSVTFWPGRNPDPRQGLAFFDKNLCTFYPVFYVQFKSSTRL